MDALGRTRGVQLLGIRIDRDELDFTDASLDHAIDGIDASTADTDHADDREIGMRRDVTRQRRALDVTARKGGSGTLLDRRFDRIGHRLDMGGSRGRIGRSLHRRRRRLHHLRVLDGLLRRRHRVSGIGRTEQIRERTVMHAGSLIRHG